MMNKLFKNIVEFMGIVFVILMALFGLTYVYAAAFGTNEFGKDPVYFLSVGIMCIMLNKVFIGVCENVLRYMYYLYIG